MNIMMLLADMPALDAGADQSSRSETAGSDMATIAAGGCTEGAKNTAAPAPRPLIEWRHSGYSEGEARRLLTPLYATLVTGAASGTNDELAPAGAPRTCLRVRLERGSIYLGVDGSKIGDAGTVSPEVLVGTALKGASEQDVVTDLQKRLDAVLLWEHRLHAEALDGLDLGKTLDIGRELTGRDIVLFDAGFRLLAYSSGAESLPPTLAYTIERGYAAPVSREHMDRYQSLDIQNAGGFEIRDLPLNENATQAPDTTKDADRSKKNEIPAATSGTTVDGKPPASTHVLASGSASPSTASPATVTSSSFADAPIMWVRSIKTRRGHLYHLHMVGVSEKDQGAIALFDSLADSLRAQLERLELSADVGLKEGFIQELVTGSRSEDELAERAWTFGFDPEGAFLAVRVQSIRYSYPRQRWEELCEIFARELPQARCAFMDEGIVVLISAGEASDSLVGTFSRLACREKVHVGVGDPARGVRSAPRAYRQACDAIGRFGQARERAARVILYDDCKPLIAREGIAKSNADGHLSPLCLQRAQTYDQTHGTEYVRTLMAYLRCARSKVETCAELSVHRNTLEYRLSRMAELFGINLDDKDLVGLLTLLAIAGEGE